MGAGSVGAGPDRLPPSWKLKPPHDQETQGLVVSGFAHLPAALALFLQFDWPENEPGAASVKGKGAWFGALAQVAAITDADGKELRAANVALTWTGLRKMGLSEDALATFSTPFMEGMYQEDRLRRLGDRIDGEWQCTVVEGGPLWSGNTPPREQLANCLSSKGDEPDDPPEVPITTKLTVHALLLLYDKDPASVQAWAQTVETALVTTKVSIVYQRLLDLRLDEHGIGREHFGFADGISQPVPYDAINSLGEVAGNLVFGDGTPVTRDPWHGVPLGEILMGHVNGHHERAPGPLIRDDPSDKPASKLRNEGAPEGFRNLGLNGSYLVVRELCQHVGAFWKSLEGGAAKIRARYPTAAHVTAEWLAERVIGRNIDGDLLCPSGVLAKDEYGCPQNAFGFRKNDPFGLGCPAGSHVRRGNPRDGLASNLAAAQTLLDAANNHRILRRGRKYGPTPVDTHQDDGEERGLLFMCLNTDIARQFEFVQQTWLLNSNFATLFEEVDPLVGRKGGFTIPAEPLRLIVEVETFVQLAGGEYFFLPSMPALEYLATL